MGVPVDASSSDPNIAAVKATQTGGGGSGVWGDSQTGAGVTGTSTSSVGVDARLQTGPAALRAIHAGDGVGVLGPAMAMDTPVFGVTVKLGPAFPAPAPVRSASMPRLKAVRPRCGPSTQAMASGFLGPAMAMDTPVFGVTVKLGPAFPAPALVRSASMPRLKAVRPRCEPSTPAVVLPASSRATYLLPVTLRCPTPTAPRNSMWLRPQPWTPVP